MIDRPKLRAVECHAVADEGRRAYLLHDPAGIAPAPLVVSPQVIFLLKHFDGRHSLPSIAEAFTRATGQLLPRERLEELVRALDEALFLESPAFERHVAERTEAYRRMPERPPAHGGEAYPEGPSELRRWFQDLQGVPLEGEPPEGTIVAAAAPHIDTRFGGASCKLVHRLLAEQGGEVDTVVILGTGHAAADHPYTLTRQHYGTPLGRVETDVELVEEIARRAPVDPFEAELLHEQEHSIEFQAVFHRLARGPDGPRIVPVLCGSFHEFVETRRRPLDDERVRGFVEAVRAAVGETGRRVQYLASIDLSHMGPRYGDEEGLDEEGFLRVEKADRDLLARAAAGDLDGFFEHQVFCRDERRVCGFSALYTLLALVPGLRGRLLRYEMTTFPGTKDTVGHCAMAFSRESPAA